MINENDIVRVCKPDVDSNSYKTGDLLRVEKIQGNLTAVVTVLRTGRQIPFGVKRINGFVGNKGPWVEKL